MSDDSTNSQVLQEAEDLDELEAMEGNKDIDLQALAEEVYALLRRELWIERERRGWRKVW
jgi:hypothetical protein